MDIITFLRFISIPFCSATIRLLLITTSSTVSPIIILHFIIQEVSLCTKQSVTTRSPNEKTDAIISVCRMEVKSRTFMLEHFGGSQGNAVSGMYPTNSSVIY